MAVEHSGITVSTDVIKSKLLDMSAEVGTTEGAFLSRGRQYRKKHKEVGSTVEISKSNDKKMSTSTSPEAVKTIRCYKCKHIGHYKNQCHYVGKDKVTTVFSVFFTNSTYKKTD
ncbi:hypothetical protein EVAR_27353_1 [Eumeta japonica]|uniref:CCHC-type domain-containing protein n=1 Tax=Eumeta variegata TaxID=151549 RepID=A0A4C1UCM9_EUMVA|nr:hypothetical protein EVAR_27353_1 [Eumeta japonica]